MTASIIDGKSIAAGIRESIKKETSQLNAQGIFPNLAVILAGHHEASGVYVRNKEHACQAAGIHSTTHRLPPSTSQGEILQLVRSLNDDPAVHGILIQMPLPDGMDSTAIINAVDPKKDVDGFHPVNMGRLFAGQTPLFFPCTPQGIIELLDRYEVEIQGRQAVVVGRSVIVGRPVSIMLLNRHATVTMCHSRTPNLSETTRTADILIAVVGKPKIITADMIKPGAVVIDVGVNRTEYGLVGDVDFDAAKKIASAITPVPGGVGPMTIAMLLKNTVKAARTAAQ